MWFKRGSEVKRMNAYFAFTVVVVLVVAAAVVQVLMHSVT